MKTKTKGQKMLEAHGFTNVKAFNRGRWFTAVDTDGVEYCFLRQSEQVWHAFYKAVRATGSGSDPRQALSGCLGDVVDFTNLSAYRKLIMWAPERLSLAFEGLYEAGVQVVN